MQAALQALAKYVALQRATSDEQRAQIDVAPADLSVLPSNLVHSDALREVDRTVAADEDGRCRCCHRDTAHGRVLTRDRGRPIYALTCACTSLGLARHIRADWSTSHLDGFLLGRAFTKYTYGMLPSHMFYDAGDDHTLEHVAFLLEYYQHGYVIKMTYVPAMRSADRGGASAAAAAPAAPAYPTLHFDIVGIYVLGDATQPIVFGAIDSVWYASVGVRLLQRFRMAEYAALPLAFRAKLDQIPSPQTLVDECQDKCPCCGDTHRADFGCGCQCSLDGMLIIMVSCVAYKGRSFTVNDKKCKWFLRPGEEAGAKYGWTEVLSGVSWTGRALMGHIESYNQDDKKDDSGDEDDDDPSDSSSDSSFD